MTSDSIKGAVQATLEQKKGIAVALFRPSTALVGLISVAICYWLWLGLTQRSINGPDAVSMAAIIGIVEHGTQMLPSGYLYHRAYVPNYLVAGAIQVFGFNNFAIMFPSLVMGLGTLLLTFLIARDILGRPWLGVLAVAILVSLQLQAFYATGPRMYMALEFFVMLALYAGWRGYILNDARFQLVTSLSLAAALLSHKEAAAFIVALPVAILAVTLINKENVARLFSPWTFVGIAILASVAYFLLIYAPSDVAPSIAYDDGRAGQRSGLHLDLVAYAKHVYNLDRTFPYGLLFIPLGLAAVFNRFRQGEPGRVLGPLFVVLALILAGLIAAAGSREIFGPRLWLFLLPLYVLIACLGVSELFHSLGLASAKHFQVKRIALPVAIVLLVGGALVGLGMSTIVRGWQPLQRIQEGYGPPCVVEDCHKSIETMYQGLRSQIKPEDLIVSSRPITTYYYWRRVDVMLREKTPEVEEVGQDEYLGIPVIDSIAELNDLDHNRKIWIVADVYIEQVVGEEVRNYISEEYTTVQSGPFMTIYTNDADTVQ